MRTLIAATGRAGVIVPSGIATDDTTKFFFRDLVEHGSLVSLFDFENKGILPGVHSSYKFCLLTLAGSRRPEREAEFVFFAHATSDLTEPERRFRLSADDFALLNPNTRTCPIFRTRRDAEITKGIYGRVPVLVNEEMGEAGNPWRVSFRQGLFNMASDSGMFRTREQLEEAGWRLKGNVFRRGDEAYLPLYEAKMTHQFDHRFGDYAAVPSDSSSVQLPDVPLERHADADFLPLPRYWVAAKEVEARLVDRWTCDWLLGWRDICRNTDERTVISAVIPRTAVGDTFLLALPQVPPVVVVGLLADLDSFVLDYVARQKLGGIHLKYHVFKQLAVFPPSGYAEMAPWEPDSSLADWLGPRVLELTYAVWDLAAFGKDLGWDGPPSCLDADRRKQLRPELDAAFFQLYGIERDDVDYIMDTFPIVRKNDEKAHGEYRTKRLILEVYDAMGAAIRSGRPYQTILDPPPGDPSVTHPPRPGEPTGRWIEPDDRPAVVAQPVPTRLRQAAVRAPTRSTHPAPQPHAEPHARAAERQSALSEAGSSTNASVQVSLDQLTRSALAGDAWIPESAVDPAELQPGRTVRHRSWGEGTIVWVRTAGRSTSLVVRFPSGDHEVLFGLGTLEFAG
jgi:hypothetical protein